MTDREILISAVGTGALIGAILVGIATHTKAQARHDHDQKWIRSTIREGERKELERYYGEPVEIVRRPRMSDSQKQSVVWSDNNRRRYREHSHEQDRDTHVATRVYGVVMRKEGFSERDATAHVTCFPPVVGRSNERSSQEKAWDDAQLDWANAVRWLYGERFQDIRNANPVAKQCSPSSISESQAGKLIQNAKEAITGNTEVSNRWRCQVRAGPCQAPIETTPAIHGEPKQ